MYITKNASCKKEKIIQSGLVTSYSGEFREILCGSEHSLLNAVFYILSTVRCAVKSNTSSRRRRQLHPASSALQITPWQAVDLPPALKLRWTSLGHTPQGEPERQRRQPPKSAGGARFKAEICRLETAERGESTIFC